MNSLARTWFPKVILVGGLLGLASCGGGDTELYITSWSAPWSSMKAGTTQKFLVRLSQVVKEKTYVDIDLGTDDRYVSTDPSPSLIIAPGTDSREVNITAKSVPAAVRVTITFKIRNAAESEPFSFEITP